MTEQSYIQVTAAIRKYKYGEIALNLANLICTGIVYATYIFIVVYLIAIKDKIVIPIIGITGVSFICLTLFRNVMDKPRPYTVYDFKPIIKKEKQGHSFPSRHVFSAFIISAVFIFINVYLGIFLLVISTIIAILRVVAGVHFPKDVIVGAFVGVLCAVIGMNLFY